MRIHKSVRGFTLVEAVIVIVITGIIGAIVAVFIRAPVQGYVDSAARAELSDVADTALRRIARDVRLALPNSIRTTSDGAGNQYLELLLTKTGGRYLAEDDGAGANFLDFTNTADTTFNVVGAMPSGAQTINQNDHIVVYNRGPGFDLGPGFVPADAYDCTVRCNRARVVAAPVGNTITLANNPFAAQSIAAPPAYPEPTVMESPSRRFQVVSTPVSYVCDRATGRLVRYWNYAIQRDQPDAVGELTTASAFGAAPENALLATNVANCVFSNNNLANVRSALVGLQITLQNPASPNAGNVVLFHQVHVDNTP